jgi:KinB signaling pathway activation protein
VTSRNVVKLFFSTLFIGGVITGIFGFIIRWNEFESYFTDFNLIKIITTLIWLIGVGFIFSILSQMGFFAYLTVHRFGLGIFRSVSLWNGVQLVLIAFVLFDLVYFRYKLYSSSSEGIGTYIGTAVLILVVGLIVAYFKAKQTNKSAYIPALFYMTVITVIEWVPAIRTNDQSWISLMIFPLLVCNAYQLLILHKLNEQSKQTRQLKQTTPKNQKSKGKTKTTTRPAQ